VVAFETISILLVGGAGDTRLDAFKAYLGSLPHILLSESAQVPDTSPDVHLMVTIGDVGLDRIETAVSPWVEGGGAWLHIVGLSEQPIPALFGAQPGPVGPACELRILFTDRDNPMAERLDDAFYVPGRFQELLVESDRAQTVIYADWHFTHRAMVVRRTMGRGQVACTTLQAFDTPDLQQIGHRLILSLSGRPFGRTLKVGILGYAPSVGRLHGLGCANTDGLEMIAACDLNQERLDQARIDFPGITRYDSSKALAEDPNVDLVIVATPPNTHAEISLQMMRAGKHVVCEKPLAITRKETDALLEAADTCGVHLSCHQNRRFDVDYLTIKRIVARGIIGDPFYLETFVGGFWHPCGYWHSHAQVSGGTAYDWGAHYLDWIVSLFPEPVASVTGTRHKRVWHDVSNADQERIQIRFRDDREAEFIHSDIAAARKPKWYLLGTRGALVGHWRDVTAYASDPDLYYRQDDIPATEMPPDIIVYRRTPSGRIEEIRPDIPPVDHYAFHRNLADHLLTGEPIAAPLQDSVKVVAILEAATRSMENGGRVEVWDD
jgi:predicted dehydrogenase